MTKNERLKSARIKSGKSQDELAAVLGVSQAYIAGLEKDAAFSFKKAQVISKLIDTSPEWLYFGDTNTTIINSGLGEEFHSAAFDAPKSINGLPHNDKIAHLKNLERQVRERHTPAVKGESSDIGIPMYNFPASASNIEMYQDENDVKILGYLKIPGAVKGSFCLPVRGDSMYPALVNGNWCVLRDMDDPSDIEWGQIYYIEYGSYRTYKRLLENPDDTETVILWSDNQTTVLNGRPIYSPKVIKINRIRRLCILTDILQKPNY